MVVFLVLQLDWIAFSDERKTMSTSDFENRTVFEHEGDAWMVNGTNTDTLLMLPIEIADSASEIRFGMMERHSFDPMEYGMLFLMPKKKIQSFWMLNTYLPLDIIYLDSNRVVSVVKNATPESKELLYSEAPADIVLEVPAGYVDTYSIEKGSLLYWTRP